MTKQSRAGSVSESQSIESLARKGSAEAIRTVRETMPSVYEHYGNLAKQVQLSWIRVIANDDRLLSSALEDKLAELVSEVAGPAPSPLEKLLSERIAACWIQLQYAETAFAQEFTKSMNWCVLQEHQKWIDRAQKRYMSALRTLALIRRYRQPALQVNIADKQVNVVGTVDSGKGYTLPGIESSERI